MHTGQQGVTKFVDVVEERQKVEILGLFNQFGKMCYSMLIKKGKDENKAFVNNTAMMKLVQELLDADELVDAGIGTCPYTGKNAVFWNSKEKSLEKVEELTISFTNVLNYMKEREIFTLSQSDLQKLI